MSTNEPMTQEQLDAIRERVGGITDGPWSYWSGRDYRENCVKSDSREDAPTVAEVIPEADDAVFIANAPQDITDLLAEVERLKRFESIVSWRYGDTTDGKTREDMIERAARAVLRGDEAITGEYTQWDNLPEGIRDNYRRTARTALDAALGTGEGS